MNRLRRLAALLALSFAATRGAHAAELPLPDVGELEPAVAEQISRMHELASSVVGNALVSAPERSNAWGEMGMLYHSYDFLTEAEECYAEAADLQPARTEWPYYRAVVASERGDIETALLLFSELVAADPDDLAARVRASDAARDLGRLDAAEELLALVSAGAQPPVLLARSGELALARGEYGAAVEELSAALDAVPAATRLHHPLGLAYRGLGDLEAARRHLEMRGEAGLKAPDPRMDRLADLRVGERVHLLDGRRAFAAGQFHEAAQSFLAAVIADPSSVRARVNLSAALAQTGDARGAEAQLREAVRLDPRNATAHFNLAILLAARGEPAQASAHYQAVVEIEPGDEQAWLQLVDSRLALGDAQNAAGVLGSALTALPNSASVAAAAARFLALVPALDYRDGARAVELASRALELQNTLENAVTLGLALREAGRCGEAQAWLDQLIEQAGDALTAEGLARLHAQRSATRAEPPCRP